MKNIFILGLRRSGTTVFWESIRKCTHYTCFDEPFNPLLFDLPLENPKQTRAEFIDLYLREPEMFRSRFSPINFHEEAARSLTHAQYDYLSYILESSGPVAVDFTRCNFKVETLHALDPNAILIYLYRDVSGFVSSNLLTSRPKPVDLTAKLKCYLGLTKLKRFLLQKNFWSVANSYNSYGYNIVFESHEFLRRVSELGMTEWLPSLTTAVEKLSFIWAVNYQWVESAGNAYYKDRFLMLRFENFALEPKSSLKRILRLAGAEFNLSEMPKLHIPNCGYMHSDPRWAELPWLSS